MQKLPWAARPVEPGAQQGPQALGNAVLLHLYPPALGITKCISSAKLLLTLEFVFSSEVIFIFWALPGSGGSLAHKKVKAPQPLRLQGRCCDRN